MASVMDGGTRVDDYASTYTTFSGCDIVATFGNVVIGELQAISYSVQREKAPVYTMGSAEPRSFSRGKRGIAGSLVFTVFDRDALIQAMEENINSFTKFQRIGGDANMQKYTIDEWDKELTRMANSSDDSYSVDDNGNRAQQITADVVDAEANVCYDDEVPPFDITISMQNEYGNGAYLVLYGVEILNEGTGFSIDSVVTEKACTFVARKVGYMKAMPKDGTLNGKSDKSQANPTERNHDKG